MSAAIAIAAALLLAVPAAAAADTYADADTGDDSADCLSPATACLTIGAALSKSDPGDTTFVAGIFDDVSITLDQGKSLLPSPSAPALPLLNGRAGIAITIDASGAGTVGGLRIRADSTPMQVDGPVTIDGNAFDVDNGGCLGGGGSDISVQTDASVAIANNGIMACSNSGASQAGVTVDSPAAETEISNNSFDNLAVGVTVLVGDATITANGFADSASGTSTGVFVNGTGGPAGATLSRNEIFGQDVGVDVVDSSSPVTLSNDLIYGNAVGLESTDTSADTPDPSTQGDVSATNVTIVDNTVTDVSLDHTTLTLDSSIIGSTIDLVGASTACAITYSRGSSTALNNGCSDFDTNADPQFVDPLTGDYHLQSTSPLIDIGNPADPGPGAVDLYGDPRAVQGNACNAARRDIGAAEFQPSSPPQCAQDTYADASAPNDNDDCLSLATACKTIGVALSKSGPDQTTFVADGTYSEAVTVGDGRSLVASDPTDPKPLVQNATPGDIAVAVDSSGAGTISGLRIDSDNLPLDVEGTVTVDGNTFDAASPSNDTHIDVEGGGSVVISNNDFRDPDESGEQIGVTLADDDSPAPVVTDNTFADLAAGVGVSRGDPQVSDNQFTGMHPVASTPLGDLPGAGVLVISGNPVITGNTMGDPSGHPSAGVYIKSPAGAPFPAGASLSRNRVTGNDVGVQVVDSTLPVTLSNDLIYGNTAGLESTDTSADDPDPSSQGNVSATNETIFDNDVDVQLDHTSLTLDSSILGTPIDPVGNSAACSISYSRGSSAPSINGCGNFSTNADPQFLDAAAGDYHLQSTSPLIDIGNPADPGLGAVDFYGGQRALQGKECSTVRRDIGAAEYDPATTPGCPAPPQSPPPDTTPAEPPPPPRIGMHPDKRSDDPSPTFRFSSRVLGSTFRCKLDHRPYKRCSSPKTYWGLDPGKHVFRVYAIDLGGTKGKPRVFRFTIIESD